MIESAPANPSRFATFDLDEVRRDLADVDREIDALTRKRHGLAAVLALAEDQGRSSVGHEAGHASSSRRAETKRPTHRAMILQVLADAGEAMGVRELMDAVQERYGEEVPRTSVSPLLRKLARRDEVIHEADLAKWRIGTVEGEVVTFRGPKTEKRDVA